MTTAMDEPDVYGTGGAAPPSFSGKMSDYSQWRVDAKIWHNGARMKDEQKESRLYSGQSNKHVKNVMLKVVSSNRNPADLGTKVLTRERIEHLCQIAEIHLNGRGTGGLRDRLSRIRLDRA